MDKQSKISKEKFFECMARDYFNNFTINLEDLKKIVKPVAPVFGELEVEIEELENGEKKVVFIDRDIADVVVCAKSEEVDEKALDMSNRVLTLNLDSNNTIKTVEHGVSLLTPANKELILFFGFLINKKLELSIKF